MQKLFEDWRTHLNEEEIDEGLEQLTPENFEIVLASTVQDPHQSLLR